MGTAITVYFFFLIFFAIVGIISSVISKKAGMVLMFCILLAIDVVFGFWCLHHIWGT